MVTKKTKKHLDFYKSCLETGVLPISSIVLEGIKGRCSGLCGCASENFIDKSLLNLLTPTQEDKDKLRMAHSSVGWWGFEGNTYVWSIKEHEFTTLRQTIVLFMAAMNNEL